MRTCPRELGRNWHTDIVKPENGCTLPPAMSADSVATWNCMSGEAAPGSARMKQPPWLMPTASGPLRLKNHCRPMRAWPSQEFSASLVVMGLLHS